MKERKNSELPLMVLFIGILFTLIGITGKVFLGYAGNWRVSSVSGGERWGLLLAGIIMIILSVRSIRTWKRPEPPQYTDDDIRQAKAKLNQMYLREHGRPPEPPKSEEGNPAATETKKTTQANQ